MIKALEIHQVDLHNPIMRVFVSYNQLHSLIITSITAVDCGDPGQLYNGYIDGRRHTYGSVIRYRCLDGTKFDGLAMSATCLETGQWSFPTPRCLSK